MVITARLAFSNKEVRVTQRGKKDDVHLNGYIRVEGKTVSGYLYNGIHEKVFYPEGLNRKLPYGGKPITSAMVAAA